MANGVDEGVVNYALYEDEKLYLGVASVTLPDVELSTFTLSGAGILGELEMPITATPKAMITVINFRHANEAAYALAEERVHNITLYRVDQNYDSTKGEIGTTNRKSFMKIFPKKLSGGELKPANPLSVSGEYAVFSYTEIVDGKTMLEVDPLNCRYIDHTGVDRAAKIRQGLGMA